MSTLSEFVLKHSIRGSCQCRYCAGKQEAVKISNGHTADLVFFEVAATGNPDADELRRLVDENGLPGYDLFDGHEHSFIEIGGYIEDQGVGLRLMGLGTLLGLWKLLTPKNVMGDTIDKEMCMKMAETGLVTIQAEKTNATSV